MSWLPEKDHPVWKLAQSIVALVPILWVSYHAAHGHTSGVDLSDAAGAGGAALAIKLLVQQMKG